MSFACQRSAFQVLSLSNAHHHEQCMTQHLVCCEATSLFPCRIQNTFLVRHTAASSCSRSCTYTVQQQTRSCKYQICHQRSRNRFVLLLLSCEPFKKVTCLEICCASAAREFPQNRTSTFPSIQAPLGETGCVHAPQQAPCTLQVLLGPTSTLLPGGPGSRGPSCMVQTTWRLVSPTCCT